MEYLDSLSEVVLVLVLVSLSRTITQQDWLAKPYKTWIVFALNFIAFTACVGAIRFAEVYFGAATAIGSNIIVLHDFLSMISTKFAMLFYACLLSVTLVSSMCKTSQPQERQLIGARFSYTDRRGQLDENKIANFALKVLLVGFVYNLLSLAFSNWLPTIISDAFVFIGLMLFFLQARTKWLVGSSIVFILAVPLSHLLPFSADVTVAVFHLLLASHFELVRRAIKKHKSTTNPANLDDFELQS